MRLDMDGNPLIVVAAAAAPEPGDLCARIHGQRCKATTRTVLDSKLVPSGACRTGGPG
jgi:hypothetical protein